MDLDHVRRGRGRCPGVNVTARTVAGRARRRGGRLSPVVCSSPNGDHDPCDQGNADDEKAGPDHVVVETRFCHARSLAAVERTTLIWVKFPRGFEKVGADLALLERRQVDAIGPARQQAGKVGLTKVQWQRPKVVAIERRTCVNQPRSVPGRTRECRSSNAAARHCPQNDTAGSFVTFDGEATFFIGVSFSFHPSRFHYPELVTRMQICQPQALRFIHS
jgi:hypothetical protein